MQNNSTFDTVIWTNFLKWAHEKKYAINLYKSGNGPYRLRVLRKGKSMYFEMVDKDFIKVVEKAKKKILVLIPIEQ